MPLQELSRLIVRQRFTMMVNRYAVHAALQSGELGPVVAFAQQKRMAFREQVTVYADESRSAVLVGFKARSVMDLRATYDVTDGGGAPIGLFRKDFVRSLIRSTWHLEQHDLGTYTGQERSPAVAVLRRFVDSLSWLPYHFDFLMASQPGFSVEKRWGLRDKYVVDIADPRLDRRLVIAQAIALDALQAR